MPGRSGRLRSEPEGRAEGSRATAQGLRGRSPVPLRAAQGDGDPGPDLQPAETLLVVLRGIGAVMFLTSQRIIVARDGVERRPRSGVTSYALSAIQNLRLERGSAPSGRIALSTEIGQEAVSMFFDARSLDRAHELIDVARPLIARQRRAGDRPARPPNGPAGSRSDRPS